MKVSRPQITAIGDEVRISAAVETRSCPIPLPATLWFSFPEKYCEHVTEDSNGFAAALLPLAMILGEDMTLEGVLSPRLLNGMKEYQRIQCEWRPSPFKPVTITAETLSPPDASACAGNVGSSFSGGVDSAYTLWNHLPENERNPSYRISHCLMINGFDDEVDLDPSGIFSGIERAMQPMMQRSGVELIVCKTNYMAFSDPNILKQSFGSMVAAPALVLGGFFSAFYIPSSYRFDDFFRDGSHLMFDHLIATESMETIHEGSHVKRTEKTETVSNWQETYSTLRVCNTTSYDSETNSVLNCCRCEKCIRTMKTLELYGQLDNYTAFPRHPRRRDVWMCFYEYRGARIFAHEIISEAFKTRQYGILFDYCVAMILTGIIILPRMLLRTVHLAFEDRSPTYAKWVRRLYPGLRVKPRLIE